MTGIAQFILSLGNDSMTRKKSCYQLVDSMTGIAQFILSLGNDSMTRKKSCYQLVDSMTES